MICAFGTKRVFVESMPRLDVLIDGWIPAMRILDYAEKIASQGPKKSVQKVNLQVDVKCQLNQLEVVDLVLESGPDMR